MVDSNTLFIKELTKNIPSPQQILKSYLLESSSIENSVSFNQFKKIFKSVSKSVNDDDYIHELYLKLIKYENDSVLRQIQNNIDEEFDLDSYANNHSKQDTDKDNDKNKDKDKGKKTDLDLGLDLELDLDLLNSKLLQVDKYLDIEIENLSKKIDLQFDDNLSSLVDNLNDLKFGNSSSIDDSIQNCLSSLTSLNDILINN
ncbi:uncharacterized protein ASCRUDRAFT_70327 [Ascoidea rubescens DSM 1968]|uniref:Uncharacterized protein n=1 Tax=Ascoidea rubescens DSM 1968 TaxID=1344418 RepID=A0A1D2VHJ6_9ASCO|nr:hypothetical protein ASCRUDRAFT_70327 [Ascoidea rubescens DSM 1968]ODV61106.1 hypothetical protein ASCRUDRAFT_70327 [Ascoidea rubescens DSM 1968]